VAGCSAAIVKELAPEFPLDVARRGYTVGTKVLESVLPPHDGPTATVPVTMSDDGLEERDGVEAKTVVLKQLVL
jgi:arginase